MVISEQPDLCPVCHKPTMLHEKACDDSAQIAEQRRVSEELDRLHDKFDALQALADEAWLDGKDILRGEAAGGAS